MNSFFPVLECPVSVLFFLYQNFCRFSFQLVSYVVISPLKTAFLLKLRKAYNVPKTPSVLSNTYVGAIPRNKRNMIV